MPKWGVSVILLCLGCSSSDAPPYELAPVTGTVKFPDGTVPQAEMSMIRFEPFEIPQKGKFPPKGGSGTIKPDGTFEIRTGPDPGAVVGKHKVTFMIDKYPPTGAKIIAEIYKNANTTPIEVEVFRGPNTFPFEVKKP